MCSRQLSNLITRTNWGTKLGTHTDTGENKQTHTERRRFNQELNLWPPYCNYTLLTAAPLCRHRWNTQENIIYSGVNGIFAGGYELKKKKKEKTCYHYLFLGVLSCPNYKHPKKEGGKKEARGGIQRTRSGLRDQKFSKSAWKGKRWRENNAGRSQLLHFHLAASQTLISGPYVHVLYAWCVWLRRACEHKPVTLVPIRKN